MSKLSFPKLLETSAIPIVAVFSVKLISIFIIAFFISESWDFVWGNFSFKYYLFSFSSQKGLILISNFSDLVTLIFISIWLVWLIFKSTFLHEENVHPILARKLYKLSIHFFICKDETIYNQLLVWLTLIWIYAIFLTVNFLSGFTSSFVYGIGLALIILILRQVWVFEKRFRS
jgi:hypothetical protein